jgi:ApbE superfamily uncharacterized protein (UPF0280 family)
VSTSAGAAAAAAAAIANAINASGALVQIEPRDFQDLVERIPDALVLHKEAGGVFDRNHQYATSHRGFVFFARTREPLLLPTRVQLLPVKKMWMPD